MKTKNKFLVAVRDTKDINNENVSLFVFSTAAKRKLFVKTINKNYTNFDYILAKIE